MRFVTPVLFLLAGFWVQNNNANHGDRILVLPFLDMVTTDVHEQGQLTVYACFGIGGVLLVGNLLSMLFNRPPPLGPQ